MMANKALRHAPKFLSIALVSLGLAFVAAGAAAAQEGVVTTIVKAPFGQVGTHRQRAVAGSDDLVDEIRPGQVQSRLIDRFAAVR